MLRDYQQRAIDQLYTWFDAVGKGNPCLVLPTGSGKSHIIAALCKDALQSWPETRILMLTHVKELIEQNAEKMRIHWPGAPMGIYSASIGKRQLGEPITFAGIQSIRKKAKDIGHIDLIIIDECHLVGHKDEGSYRTFLSDMRAINEYVRVIGLTATPYRLGHGMITDKPAMFDDLIEPVTIEELIFKKYLAPLRSKLTRAALDTSGVHKRGGEFIESELQAAVDTEENNSRIVKESIALAGERKAWLFFCAGVLHAQHVCDELKKNDVPAECVTGQTTKQDRQRIINDFKSGKLRALTNANILTTGFDYPDIDMIVMMRPTMSPSLYVQMAGRGMRVKSHTDHCLVLDFAGVVSTHGPITAVQPPNKRGDRASGDAPTKVCDECGEICAASARKCSSCDYVFPISEKEQLELRNDDIMGVEASEISVISWVWRKHTSRASGKEMLSCTYYGSALSQKPVIEYLPVLHGGYAAQKALSVIALIAKNAGADLSKVNTFEPDESLNYMVNQLNKSSPPLAVKYKIDGKFHRVVDRIWEQCE